VCARGSNRALTRSPSTSPLGCNLNTLAHRQSLALAGAVLLGAGWNFMLTKLFLLGSYIDVPLMQWLFRAHLLTRDHFHVLYRPLLAMICTGLIGIIFGVPFGILARRYTLSCWAAFVLAVLASSAISHWARGPSWFTFADLWSIPEAWLYLVGVLLFALITANLLNRRAIVAT